MNKLLCLLLLLPFVANAQTSLPGNYSGLIIIPGQKLKVVVHIVEDDRKLSGTIDIPEQKATGLKLDNVKYINNELTYGIPDVPGNCMFKGSFKPGTDSLNGTFTQGGMSLPMLTKKISEQETQQAKADLKSKIKKIEVYADSLLRKGELAGMSVAIVKDNEVLLNRGFGYRDYDKKIKCDENTLYAIGSCSKAFTAALLATLNDEGLYDWEKPIKEYVPYFGMKDRFANEQLNGIDMCSHRCGLPRHDLVWYGSNMTRKETVARIKYMEPNKPFRTTWQYNNFMFVTAGVVAEEIAKDSWENLVQKRIFDQLGMKGSKIHYNDFIAVENKSLGYEVKDKKITVMPYRNIDEMGPAGSIFSNSTDMIQWVNMFLNDGKQGDKTIISKEQCDFLLEPKMIMNRPSEAFKGLSYAMGWMVAEYKGKTYIEHGGNIDGFTANVAMVPEEKLGIVILANKNGTSINELLALYITDQLVGNPEYDWYEEKIAPAKKAREEEEKKKAEEEAKNKAAKNKKPVKPEVKKGPMHDLQAYVGEYTDDAYGTIKIEMKDKALNVKYNSFEFPVKHDSFENFTITMMDDQEMKMTFFTGTSGKVEWMQIQLEPMTPAIKFVRKSTNYLNDAAYIAKIAGEYTDSGMILKVAMEGKKLMARLSDGQAYEIISAGENLFKLKDLEGYTAEFVFDEKGNTSKIVLHQPNGDFSMKRR